VQVVDRSSSSSSSSSHDRSSNNTTGTGRQQQLKKKFTRSTAYVDQGDLSLTPILTVKETIEFARRCAEGYEKTTPESIQKVFELVGLDHVQDTVVGNADIRGVSGGQKRRVKVLEQAVGDQVVCVLLDEITNGLDAASAYQVCQVVRTRYGQKLHNEATHVR
jgi:ABC-type multidrug transport system ATPase subunit